MRLPGVTWSLASSRLTVVLLILLAAVAAWGTFADGGAAVAPQTGKPGHEAVDPVRLLGIRETFRSPLFIGLLLLLALNTAFCGWRRMRLGGSSRRPADWLDALMHFSVILILAGGAAKAVWSFAGTQYLFTAEPVENVYDPRGNRDIPLGFTLLLKESRERYYPLMLRLEVSSASGASGVQVSMREGETARVPGTDITLQAAPGEGGVRLKVLGGAGEKEFLLEPGPGGAGGAVYGSHRLTLLAWRRDLKNFEARVSVLGAGSGIREGWISPNHPLVHEGIGIFVTGWGRDDHMRDYVTIQAVREAGAPIFWGGCILFSVSLTSWLVIRRGASHVPGK